MLESFIFCFGAGEIGLIVSLRGDVRPFCIYEDKKVDIS